MPDVPPAGTDPHSAPPPEDAPQITEITQEQLATLRQVPSPPSAGGGYSLTPTQIESALSQCNTLVDALSAEAYDIESLGQVDPVAPDKPGSVLQCEALREFGRDLRMRNADHVMYLNRCLQNLAQAKRNYMTAEHLTEHQWSRLASGFPK